MEYSSPQPPWLAHKPRPILVLLLLLGALLAIAGTVRMLRPQMDERLYARFRALPTAPFEAVSAAAPDSGYLNLHTAGKLFNKKNYSKALLRFEQLPDSLKNTAEVQLFTALCLLELNKMKEAEALLIPLLAPEVSVVEEARWYYALSLLRRHQRTKSLEVLRQIKTGTPRHEAALLLRKKLGDL